MTREEATRRNTMPNELKPCPECDTNCHNCKYDVYDDFCRYYGTHGCDKKHFEPKSKFCPMCGRKLGKNNE